jgi:hypothetical protein
LRDAAGRGAGRDITEYLPGTWLVRAFNATNAGPLALYPLPISLASADPNALKIAFRPVSEAGAVVASIQACNPGVIAA